MPIIWIAIAFFAGVISADILSLGTLAWMIFGIGGSLLLIGLFWLKIPGLQGLSAVPRGLIISLFFAFAAGGIRYLLAIPDFKDPTYLSNFTENQTPVTITGIITDFPDSRDQVTILRVKTELIQITADGDILPVYGLLLAKIPVEDQDFRFLHYLHQSMSQMAQEPNRGGVLSSWNNSP